jgi:hypothetical protein
MIIVGAGTNFADRKVILSNFKPGLVETSIDH